jgi:hypothetical protein
VQFRLRRLEGKIDLPTLFRPSHALIRGGALLAAIEFTHPAGALTITPYFDSSIVGASNQSAVEGAIDSAINTIDGLYSTSGTVSIVFSQADGSYLGQSGTADYNTSYATYIASLKAVSAAEPTNTVLATAVNPANLAVGNQPGANGAVILTSADARVVLGSSATPCFNSSGTFVAGCNQVYDGTVTLTNNPSYSLNYGTTAVAGAYSMIDTAEHEIDEILGGGGQGSVLNSVAYCAANPTNQTCINNSNYANDVGGLDLYRYSAKGVKSFSTSGSATSYLSVDGGKTSIVCLNQSSTGDYADFCTNTNVQSAFSNAGTVATYNQASPEYAMMEAIGYNGVVPEPASLAVFVSGLAGLRMVRRRFGRKV